MNDHTKEPWEVFGRNEIVNIDRELLAVTGNNFENYYDMSDKAYYNAHRIVACVNACKEIGSGTLQAEGVVTGGEYRDIYLKNNALQKKLDIAIRDKELAEIGKEYLKAQRDQLLAVLESFGHKSGCRKNAFGDTCTCGVDSVIASVKGGAE